MDEYRELEAQFLNMQDMLDDDLRAELRGDLLELARIASAAGEAPAAVVTGGDGVGSPVPPPRRRVSSTNRRRFPGLGSFAGAPEVVGRSASTELHLGGGAGVAARHRPTPWEPQRTRGLNASRSLGDMTDPWVAAEVESDRQRRGPMSQVRHAALHKSTHVDLAPPLRGSRRGGTGASRGRGSVDGVFDARGRRRRPIFVPSNASQAKRDIELRGDGVSANARTEYDSLKIANFRAWQERVGGWLDGDMKPADARPSDIHNPVTLFSADLPTRAPSLPSTPHATPPVRCALIRIWTTHFCVPCSVTLPRSPIREGLHQGAESDQRRVFQRFLQRAHVTAEVLHRDREQEAAACTGTAISCLSALPPGSCVSEAQLCCAEVCDWRHKHPSCVLWNASVHCNDEIKQVSIVQTSHLNSAAPRESSTPSTAQLWGNGGRHVTGAQGTSRLEAWRDCATITSS
jgi:hypothetical protein